MRAQLLDADALRAISPTALGAYARAEGWTKSEPFGTHSDVYAADARPEIIMPRTDQLGDYPMVVSQLVTIFARCKDTDELAIYRDLTAADRDVIRVRSSGGDDDGSIDIDAGVKIVAQSRDLLLAAACAARSPQPLFRAGANKDAIDYMRRVRLGQTEHGSFVVTLLAPVPPLLQPPLDPSWACLEDEPFDRQVTRRLVGALEASRTAAELTAAGEGIPAFERAVSAGVSANLCEALANLIEQTDRLDITLTWARTRPTPEPHRRIAFSKSDADTLKEAARTFRVRHSKADVELFGTVHKLSRDETATDGRITLKAMVDGRPQSVSAVLDQANYSIALRAHDARLPVVIQGDLERVGQRWQLTNARLTDVPAGEDDDGPGWPAARS